MMLRRLIALLTVRAALLGLSTTQAAWVPASFSLASRSPAASFRDIASCRTSYVNSSNSRRQRSRSLVIRSATSVKPPQEESMSPILFQDCCCRSSSNTSEETRTTTPTTTTPESYSPVLALELDVFDELKRKFFKHGLAVPSDNNSDEEIIKQKILNGVLLAVTFGYAAYTIFNIDAGMTRGWTQSEIAMRIPLDNWSNYESSLAEKPVYTKTLINVVIYLLGDWLSQTVFQKKNVLDFDASRTLKNGLIGLCFGPLVHEYYQFSDHILPPDTMVNRVEKIFMDQTIYLSVKASIYVAAVTLLGTFFLSFELF
jgi:hypothetical protein